MLTQLKFSVRPLHRTRKLRKPAGVTYAIFHKIFQLQMFCKLLGVSKLVTTSAMICIPVQWKSFLGYKWIK